MAGQLEEIWLSLCSRYSPDRKLAGELYEEISRRYSAFSRHYHNLQHIAALLSLSGQYSPHLQDKDIVDSAIFYHDIIYNVLRKDNERRSAVLAAKRLTTLGWPAGKREVVVVFIEATKSHQIPGNAPNASDLAWFLDFDMAILAAPWEAYSQYAAQVRREYRIYPGRLYKPGRNAFLQQTLQAPHIFHTAVFREQYEPAARANMERELGQLDQ